MVIPIGPHYAHQARTYSSSSSSSPSCPSSSSQILNQSYGKKRECWRGCACPRMLAHRLCCCCCCCCCSQVLTVVDRDMAGQLHSEALMDVGYVPLTRPADYEDGCLPGP
jgi:hypothetical protein